jgi:hypothetical protein
MLPPERSPSQYQRTGNQIINLHIAYAHGTRSREVTNIEGHFPLLIMTPDNSSCPIGQHLQWPDCSHHSDPMSSPPPDFTGQTLSTSISLAPHFAGHLSPNPFSLVTLLHFVKVISVACIWPRRHPSLPICGDAVIKPAES